MDVELFRESALSESRVELPFPLLGLWYDARGDWSGAHEAVQSDDSPEAAWVHAYLHRKEGDVGNAGYWYRRAGKAPASGDFDAEWEQIARALLARLG